jgi:integrase
MPAATPPRRLPKYRHYKPKDLAVVRLDGRDVYLGRFDSPESREKYRRVVAAWLANLPKTEADRPAVHAEDPTVAELLLAYLRFVDGYYLKDGAPTKEPVNIRLALRPLRRLYGHTPARDFGPLALKAVRQAMIEAGLCRNEVNKRVRHVVRAFKWAVENELVPSAVHHGLKAVSGLRRGRSAARESEPVWPVAKADVEAIRPRVSRQVWAMIELQRLTGMRPGEVVQIRTADLDMAGAVWSYTPREHKTQHHGHERVVYLGPKAQEVLRPWLRADRAAYLFSPAEAVEERWARLRAARQTPLTPTQRARRRQPRRSRPLGAHYTTMSYGHAIAKACQRAGVPRWHPHQLRHSAATRLRREFGLDTARAVLGHASSDVTETYAEMDMTKAAEAMKRIG